MSELFCTKTAPKQIYTRLGAGPVNICFLPVAVVGVTSSRRSLLLPRCRQGDGA